MRSPMKDLLVVHLDSPSIAPTISRFPLAISGWLLVPDTFSPDFITRYLELSVVVEQSSSLRAAEFNAVTLAGQKISDDASKDFYLSKPVLVQSGGRRVAAQGFANYRCYDFAGEIESSVLRGATKISMPLRLSVVAQLEDLRGVSEISQIHLMSRDHFLEPQGGFYSPTASLCGGDFLYVEGWAHCADDELEKVEVAIGETTVGQLQCGVYQAKSANNFPDIMRRGAGFVGVLSRAKVQSLCGKSALSGQQALYARCCFASGKTLQLEIHGFIWMPSVSAVQRRQRILGRVESVQLLHSGRIQCSGWVLNLTGDHTAFSLCAGRKKISLDEISGFSSLHYLQRPDVEQRFSELCFTQTAGFQLTFDPEVFGKFPGGISVVAAGVDGKLKLTSGLQEFALAKLVAKALVGKDRVRTFGHWLRYCQHLLLPVPKVELSKSQQKKRKVLLAMHNLSETEGAPKVFFNIAKHIVEQRLDFELHVVAAAGGGLQEAFEALHIPVTLLPELSLNGLDLPRYYRGLSKLCQLLKEEEFQFVYANVIDSFFAVDAAFRLGLTTSWLVHESVNPLSCFAQLPSELRSIFLSRLQTVDELLFVSRATQQMFVPFLFHNRTSVIHNGVDIAEIETQRKAMTREQARALIGVSDASIAIVTIIGTTTHRKGQDVFLKEMAKLAAAQPQRRFAFLIVGAREGSFLDSLRSLAEQLQIAEQISFVAETPDVSPYFLASDVMVVASREESSPLVSLEAFAYQRPLVSTTVFGLAEQVRDSANALAFDIDQPGAMADAVWQLLSDGSLRESIVKEARRDVEQQFLLSASLSQHSKHIAQLLDLCSKAR